MIRELEAVEAIQKSESRRLADLAKASGRAADHLRQYVARQMLKADRPKVRLPFTSLWIGTAVTVEWVGGDPRDIPEPFRRTKIVHEPDKMAVKEEIARGGEIPEGFQVIEEPFLGMR
jgi:hypothetical protein